MISQIENRFIKEYPTWISVGQGWHDLLVRLDRQLSAVQPDYEIVQVKEKFGGLRFYTTNVHPENMDTFRALIDAAESESFRTCEECGGHGKIGGDHWITTLCDECRRERG